MRFLIVVIVIVARFVSFNYQIDSIIVLNILLNMNFIRSINKTL